MRAVTLPVLLLVASGCLAGPDLPLEAATLPRSPFPPLPDGAAPFTHRLCQGDAVLPIAGTRGIPCDVRVTHENGPAAEVSLAVNPLNPLNLVGGAKDFTLGRDGSCGEYNVWSGTYWSHDGGRTWKNGLLPGHPGDDNRTALSDYACGSDPVVVFGPDGAAYYTSLMYTPGAPPPHPILAPVASSQQRAALAVTRSPDGGETWQDPVLAVINARGGLDKQWLAADPESGRLYLSYNDFAADRVRLVASDDQGRTWSDPVDVAVPGGLTGQPAVAHMSQVAVGPEGIVHLIYFAVRQHGGAATVEHRASRDGGRTWDGPRTALDYVPLADLGIIRKYRMLSLPALAVDAAAGTVYVAVPARNQGDADILLAASDDEGRTWRRPVRLNDDSIQPLNDQWMPALTVGPDGTVHATWIDYRGDATGQWAHVYYAHSTNGGRTWSQNARLSESAFDGTGGHHQTGSGTVGDYMGLAASPHAVHAFWADTRHGRNDIFTATLLGAG
jgi:hypothetical protein